MERIHPLAAHQNKKGWHPHPSGAEIAWSVLVLCLLVLAGCTGTSSHAGLTPQTPTLTGKRLPTQATATVPPVPAGGGISFIRMNDPTTGWAVTTDQSHILRTTDGGMSWEEVTPPFSLSLQEREFREYFLSASLAWVVIAGSVPGAQVFRTTDGGQTWQVSTVPTTIDLGPITFVDPEHGWFLSGIVAAAGPKALDVFRTFDGGATWSEVSAFDLTSMSPDALPPGAQWLSFLDPSTGWATGASPVSQFVWLYVTHDGGSTWQHHSLPPPTGTQGDLSMGPITFFNRNEGILSTCSSSTVLYVTHNGGTTWQHTSLLPSSNCARLIDFLDSTRGWVSVESVTAGVSRTELYQTTDGGEQWAKLPTSPNFIAVSSLDFVSNTIGWATSALSSGAPEVFKTMDGGQTWMPVSSALA